MRFKYPIQQSDPPLSPRETLPTMYDLPSENPEEPGLPDEFHDLQPELLRQTFCSPKYESSRTFSASDMNLYYDVHHQNWYKRPDWFGVVGVPRLYDGTDLRLSYVIWQEGIAPKVVVELLSPGTEDEDLGKTRRQEDKPPTKWEVYEKILQVPYYVVFDRYCDHLRGFRLVGGVYEEITLKTPQIWISDLDLGLGLWKGTYSGIDRLWLRWCDRDGNWIPTPNEREFSAQQQLQVERERADRLEQLLRSRGIDPDSLVEG